VLTPVFTSLAPTYHSGLGSPHDYSPCISPVFPPSNPGGFRLDIVDYGCEMELPRASFPGGFRNAASHSEISFHDSGGHPQPGGFIVPGAPAYAHTSNNNGPGGNPPWVGGFGAYR